MLGGDARAKVLEHLVILVGTFLTPFLAGVLQRYVVNPVVACMLWVFKKTAYFIWQAVVFAVLSSLIVNTLPHLARLTLDLFAHYGLYDSWLMQALMDAARRAAQQALVAWVLQLFAGLSEGVVLIIKSPLPAASFVVSQLNETWNKFAT